MNLIERFTKDLASRRAQHLVYLLLVWLCVPFLLFWVTDKRSVAIVGPAIGQLRLLAVVMVSYMVVRTWLAYLDPPKLKWWFVFPPIDVGLITAILCITHRGPMSNIAYLYFLPMVQASGSLNVRWSAAVGLMVIVGTALATQFTQFPSPDEIPKNFIAMLHDDPLNVAFRVVFLIVVSCLMAYQTLIASGFRERLGVAADRNRIAMEMHDGVQGHLITISSQLELISRLAETDGKHAAEIALAGREGARQAADELRFLVQRLRTPTMESGFVAALRQYAHNICERNRLKLVFEVTGVEVALSPEVENALFRIAQEALTNIVKHAQAQSVVVNVDFGSEKARLSVSDDGQGFDSGAVGVGIGLEGMRERATANHGKLILESTATSGTSLSAEFAMGGPAISGEYAG